jgi:tetratricopeptide (TPR) repeat protein
MSARILLPLVLLLSVLCADVGHAGWAACDSAGRKTSPDDQIRLYTACIANGGIRGGDIAYALRGRAYAYARKDDLDHALEDVNRSLKYNPIHQDAYDLRSYIYARRMQWDLADQDLTTIVEHTAKRHQADAYLSRGAFRFCLGRCEDALRDVDQALAIYPKQSLAYGFKAGVLSMCADERVRNGAEALSLARRYLALRDDWSSHLILAAAFAEAGQFTDSVREIGIAETMASRGGAGKRDLRRLAESRALLENAQPLRQGGPEQECFGEPPENHGEDSE